MAAPSLRREILMAMAEDQIEIVRTALTALDRRDLELYLSIASPEIELFTPASPLEGPSVGHEGIRRFFEETEAHTESSSVEKLRRARIYADRREALQAAGLSE
jgi:ketosteroid isomerase-like protein